MLLGLWSSRWPCVSMHAVPQGRKHNPTLYLQQCIDRSQNPPPPNPQSPRTEGAEAVYGALQALGLVVVLRLDGGSLLTLQCVNLGGRHRVHPRVGGPAPDRQSACLRARRVRARRRAWIGRDLGTGWPCCRRRPARKAGRQPGGRRLCLAGGGRPDRAAVDPRRGRQPGLARRGAGRGPRRAAFDHGGARRAGRWLPGQRLAADGEGHQPHLAMGIEGVGVPAVEDELDEMGGGAGQGDALHLARGVPAAVVGAEGQEAQAPPGGGRGVLGDPDLDLGGDLRRGGVERGWVEEEQEDEVWPESGEPGVSPPSAPRRHLVLMREELELGESHSASQLQRDFLGKGGIPATQMATELLGAGSTIQACTACIACIRETASQGYYPFGWARPVWCRPGILLALQTPIPKCFPPSRVTCRDGHAPVGLCERVDPVLARGVEITLRAYSGGVCSRNPEACRCNGWIERGRTYL